MGNVYGCVSGPVFGLGLGLILAGMTDPAKVKGFLDLAGAWDPGLPLVMGGAIALGVDIFARAARRQTAWSGASMEILGIRTIDARLVLGGVLFGVGWGIAGFCPGPAVVALGSVSIFGAAMLAGTVAHDRWLASRCAAMVALTTHATKA